MFWTLSVWESEAALEAFVARDPHADIMSAMQPRMGRTRFLRWHIRGAEVPPRWRDALERRASPAP